MGRSEGKGDGQWDWGATGHSTVGLDLFRVLAGQGVTWSK